MLTQKETILVIVDVQGRLADVMHDRETLFPNINRLCAGAKELGIPRLITEQLPDKLGPTRAELMEHLADAPVISKSSFSCAGEPEFMETLKNSGKKQVLLCGIESHICILQTALDLLAQGYELYIAADAVSSRSPENKQIALDRLRQHGVEITVSESVLFEWLRDAAHPAFREVRKFLS